MTPPVALHDLDTIVSPIYIIGPMTLGISQPVTPEINIEELLRKVGQQTRVDAEKSVFFGALSDLRSLVYEYHVTRTAHGWDGYDALPITASSLDTALAIIDALPAGIQKPELVPISAGGYSFDWDTDYSTFSLVVEDKELVWSFIHYGSSPKRKRSGSEENFAGKLPEDVQKILMKEFLVG